MADLCEGMGIMACSHMNDDTDAAVMFGTLTRGRGKIFIHVELKNVKAYQLRVKVKTDSGGAVPAQVFEHDEVSAVVCLPVLRTDQHVELFVGSETGDLRILGSCVVSERGASLVSKFNTARKSSRANLIRNWDGKAFRSRVTGRINIETSETIVIKGILDYFDEFDRHLKPSDIEISVIDVRGENIQSFVCAMGRMDKEAYYSSAHEPYRYLFSSTIDRSRCMDGYIVWAKDRVSGDTVAFDSVCCDEVAPLIEARNEYVRYSDADPRYHDWFLARRATPRLLAEQRAAQESFAYRPLISIIVPLFKTPVDLFRTMIESVACQSYPRFELVLVNASPECAELNSIVNWYASRDERIKVCLLDKNRGITENTNEGIAAATGDFLAFMDHDDVLEPDALYWYVKAINDYPDTDLLYCDEDRLDGVVYASPFFKPDWDIDYLMGFNYVCHMLMVRSSLLRQIDYRPGSEYDGAQDHHLTFVAGERARNIFHVRRVLYHWRRHALSLTGSQAKQRELEEAQRLCVQGHLDRCDIDAKAVMGLRRAERCAVDYAIPRHPLVSFIIPNYNSFPVLKRCIDSFIELTKWPNYEIVIVENNSTDPELFTYYRELERKHANIQVVTCILEHGFNFSRLINFGVSAAHGDYLLMLNNDTEALQPEWLDLMMGICMRDDVGCVGAKLLYPDDTIQHVSVAVGRGLGPYEVPDATFYDNPGYLELNVLPHQASAVTGAVLLTKRSAFDKVGGMDEDLPNDYNDVDYCLRIREAGYAVVAQPEAIVRHYHSVSRGVSLSDKWCHDIGFYFSRWGRYLYGGDPFYSVNFGSMNASCGLFDR